MSATVAATATPIGFADIAVFRLIPAIAAGTAGYKAFNTIGKVTAATAKAMSATVAATATPIGFADIAVFSAVCAFVHKPVSAVVAVI